MEKEKYMAVQIGTGASAVMRAVPESRVQALLQAQKELLELLIMKGFPKEVAEERLLSRVIGPWESMTMTDTTEQ